MKKMIWVEKEEDILWADGTSIDYADLSIPREVVRRFNQHEELVEALLAFVRETRPMLPSCGVYSSQVMRDWVKAISPVFDAADRALDKAMTE